MYNACQHGASSDAPLDGGEASNAAVKAWFFGAAFDGMPPYPSGTPDEIEVKSLLRSSFIRRQIPSFLFPVRKSGCIICPGGSTSILVRCPILLHDLNMADYLAHVRRNDDAIQIQRLLADIRDLILSARRAVVRSVDTLQVLSSFEIGRRIVEHEQQDAARAEYGKRGLGELADQLTEEFGRGYSRSNLQNMRNFFLVYRDRSSQICQMTPGKWKAGFSEKRQTASGKSRPNLPSMPAPPAQFTQPFPLGWSQYVFLLGIDDADERTFYEIESVRNSWTLLELKRQFSASLYERLALSRDKRGIRKLARRSRARSSAGRKTCSKNHTSWNFSDSMRRLPIPKPTWNRPSSTNSSTSCWNSARGFLFEARQRRRS